MRDGLKQSVGVLLLLAMAITSANCTKKSHRSPGSGGGAPDPTAPGVSIETPTTAGAYTTSINPILLGGVASDDRSVTMVTWHNTATGESSAAAGTTSWSARVPLVSGDNSITVIAYDEDDLWATDTITVTFSQGSAVVTGWGYNVAGQIGDGTTTHRLSPVNVVDPLDPSVPLAGVAAVSAGGLHSAALLGDGTVRAWGDNEWGQLGDGTTRDSDTPVQVVDPADSTGVLTGVTKVSAGDGYTVALKGDGTLRAWGSMLGNGTSGTSAVPVGVIDPDDPTGLLTGVAAVSAGQSVAAAVKADGTVWTWGNNSHGQLGRGSGSASSLFPVQVVDLTDPTGFLTGMVAVSAGHLHVVALAGDGTVWSWGALTGDGTLVNSFFPVQATDSSDPSGTLTDITAVAAGGAFSLALKADGTVRAWGSDVWGELGDDRNGYGAAAYEAVQVLDPSDPTGHLTSVVDMDGGAVFSVALKGDGTIRAWGTDTLGQLGDGSRTDSYVAKPVPGLAGVQQVSASPAGNHALALQ